MPAAQILAVHTLMLATDAVDDIVPADNGARLVFAVVAVVIIGLYFTIRRTQKRSADAYWEQRRRQDDLRANDPDMKQEPDTEKDP